VVPERPGDTTSGCDFWQGLYRFVIRTWLVPNPNPDEAPVVLFGSEGEFIVLASNASEFCRLLGLGYDEVEYDDLSAPPAEWAETVGLRNWLAERFKIDFPTTGEEIARVARERHPGFGDWMRQWQAANL
jgi:hypothetical protein